MGIVYIFSQGLCCFNATAIISTMLRAIKKKPTKKPISKFPRVTQKILTKICEQVYIYNALLQMQMLFSYKFSMETNSWGAKLIGWGPQDGCYLHYRMFVYIWIHQIYIEGKWKVNWKRALKMYRFVAGTLWDHKLNMLVVLLIASFCHR